MFKIKGPAMIKNSYPPAFPLKHQQKDMRLALALGDENAVPMPVAAAANEVSLHLFDLNIIQFFLVGFLSLILLYTFCLQAFKKARSLGLGDHDFSAVFETLSK